MKKKLFIEKYRQCGTRLVACKSVNIARKTVNNWEQSDPVFASQMRDAERDVIEILENTALDRATKGGSDQLLMFLLKALDRNKYGERIRHEFAMKTLDAVVTEVIEAIRVNVPEFCPHCRTALEITPAIAKDLTDMSARLTGAVREEETVAS